MTTHITKTWFDGKSIVTQEIPVGEVYKREWVGLAEHERVAIAEACGAMSADWLVFVEAVEKALKEKNT